MIPSAKDRFRIFIEDNEPCPIWLLMVLFMGIIYLIATSFMWGVEDGEKMELTQSKQRIYASLSQFETFKTHERVGDTKFNNKGE